MQDKAAIEFYKTKNWEKAARAAGYKSASAASELRCNSNVRERVKQLESEDSLAEYATLPHCTNFLIRAALGQIVECNIGNERFQTKVGSKVRKQIFLEKDGTVRGKTITFEHDPLRALELLLKVKGWLDGNSEVESTEKGSRSDYILSVVQKMVKDQS